MAMDEDEALMMQAEMNGGMLNRNNFRSEEDF